MASSKYSSLHITPRASRVSSIISTNTSHAIGDPTTFNHPTANPFRHTPIPQPHISASSNVTHPMVAEPNQIAEKDSFSTPDEFESMVGELRRTFIGWLKKTEMGLRRELEELKSEKETFENLKIKTRKELEEERKLELEKIEDMRRRADIDAKNQIKQIGVEREEARKRVKEEKKTFEGEKELQKRNFAMEQDKFRREYEQLEAEKKRIMDCNIATETLVSLNVGGVSFETARHTLTQQQGSFLEGIINGRHQMSRDRQGRIFLDKDAEVFREILSFLRNPTVLPYPKDSTASDILVKDADWYGVRFFPYPLVFACAGHDGTQHLSSVEVLDVEQQCWRQCKSTETERCYFGGGVLKGRVYIFGGQNLDYKALADAEVYDALRDDWTGVAPLTVPRRNSVGAVFDQRIFAIGGFDGTSILDAVESYDPRMRYWVTMPSLPTPRSSAMSTAVDNRIIVLGGTKGERLSTVDIFDIRANKWQNLDSTMLETRSAGSACSVCGEIFAMGGTDKNHQIHRSVESFNFDSQTWIYRKDMKYQRMDASCLTVSDSIMISGGQSGEVLNSVEFYRHELDEWNDGPPMLSPRYGHCLLLAAI